MISQFETFLEFIMKPSFIYELDNVGLSIHDYFYKLPTLCELLIFLIWDRGATTILLK